MQIPTNDVPQADDLDLVVRAVEAVGRGARTYQEIAAAVGNYDPRQGRYYRRAAEILGFIRNLPGENSSTLTTHGRALVRSVGEGRREILARGVLSSRLMQRVVPYLESNLTDGVSRDEVRRFITSVTETTTPAMVNRRLATILGWLTAIRMLRAHGDRYYLQELPPGVPILDYAATDEPLLPRSHELTEYQTVARRVQRGVRNISVLIDAAARERANDSHRMLTDLVARKIRAAGAIPKRNRLIDLSARLRDHDYLFEMKSTTAANAHGQLRAAISQLYEYRYMQNTPTARLVVVIEHPPPRDVEWMVDYIVRDRSLLIAWDGDRRTLRFPDTIRNDLAFLA